MSSTKDRFVPLYSASQHGGEDLFFYDSHASVEGLYDGITGRVHAVIGLLQSLYEYKADDPTAVSAVAVICAIMLSDAYSLLDEFQPSKLKAKLGLQE